MSHPLFGELDFLHSNEGVLIGTVALGILWITLTVLERRGRRMGSVVSRTIKLPLMLGLAAALYCGWLTELVEASTNKINSLASARLSASITILAISWAAIRLGHTVLRSRRFEDWLQVEDPKDEAMLISLLDRLFTIAVVVLCGAALMVTFGVNSTAVATLLGGAGIGIGFGTQQISQNFLSGFMLFFNRPFKEGDWISTTGLEGTVESIGWYHTRLRTFDRRPLYIPNAVFATNPIENPGQMYNRRIKTSLSLRYEDITRVQAVTEQIREMLQSHPEIDQNQTILVNFNEWDSSSVNVMIYCFTHTTVWKEWLDVQQQVFLDIAQIVKGAGADFAFPATTFYPAPQLPEENAIRKLNVA